MRGEESEVKTWHGGGDAGRGSIGVCPLEKEQGRHHCAEIRGGPQGFYLLCDTPSSWYSLGIEHTQAETLSALCVPLKVRNEIRKKASVWPPPLPLFLPVSYLQRFIFKTHPRIPLMDPSQRRAFNTKPHESTLLVSKSRSLCSVFSPRPHPSWFFIM